MKYGKLIQISREYANGKWQVVYFYETKNGIKATTKKEIKLKCFTHDRLGRQQYQNLPIKDSDGKSVPIKTANEIMQLDCEAYKIEQEIKKCRKEYRKTLEYLINNAIYLQPKIHKILKMRWVEKKTLEQVGKEFNVTKERIRQLEAKGFEHISNFISEVNEKI